MPNFLKIGESASRILANNNKPTDHTLASSHSALSNFADLYTYRHEKALAKR